MFKELEIKQVYSSVNDDLLNDFYIPVLSKSKRYDRIAGFFSSKSLVYASQGMAEFFSGGGTYRLITGTIFEPQDFAAIRAAGGDYNQFLEERLNFDPKHFVDEIEMDYLKVFAFLLQSNRLEIKVAIMPEGETGLFHEKIGIFTDSRGDLISFSGSINETAAGWGRNVEEFKVFRGWDAGEKKYLDRDISKFESYWSGNINNTNIEIVDLPAAIAKRIIQISPKNSAELDKSLRNIRKFETVLTPRPRELYEFQLKAVKAWQDNDYNGVFEMATGTGKTLTSLGAVTVFHKAKGTSITVIGVPQKHLVTQWLEDVVRQMPKAYLVEVHSDSHDWKTKLASVVADFADGFISQVIVIATHNALASQAFRSILDNPQIEDRLLLIADEMHNLGAKVMQNALVPTYRFRLGLSATPVRAYDEEGTDALMSYFGKTVYSYPLASAISDGWLTKYDYYPVFVHMTDEEYESYQELSQKIVKASHFGDKDDGNGYMEMLLIARSRIVKRSEEKMNSLDDILTTMQGEMSIEHLLVYCDQGDQLQKAQEILNNHRIINHRFTENESMRERKRILYLFDTGSYDCLLAVKCLDEGVNVPSTKTAIILASSTNPREYIQRRGRVLRTFPGKEKAAIYDFVVLPPSSCDVSTMINAEKQIIKKELRRVEDFFETADNRNEILISISDVMEKYGVYLG